jgi:hypothetical protein
MHMLVSIGSRTNVEDADGNPEDVRRADVLEYTPSLPSTAHGTGRAAPVMRSSVFQP